MAGCGNFAVAARAIGPHLNVQHSLVGAATRDAQCVVFAVVNRAGHVHFLVQNRFQLSPKFLTDGPLA
jgi:hypothetical protein